MYSQRLYHWVETQAQQHTAYETFALAQIGIVQQVEFKTQHRNERLASNYANVSLVFLVDQPKWDTSELQQLTAEENLQAEQLHSQKHFRWTIDGPGSSYSALAIHICISARSFVSSAVR